MIVNLVNDRNLMGDYTNKPAFNTIAWITVVSMITLTFVMTVDIAFPGLLMRVFSF